MNILIICQFSFESVGAALTLTNTLGVTLFGGDQNVIYLIVTVLAMIAPVMQRFYDAVIVQMSKVMRKDGFTWKGFFFSMIGFIVFLPTMIIRLSGCECGSSIAMGATEMAGDDMNKLATKMANEGLVASVEAGVAEIASRAFWQAHMDQEFRKENEEEIAEKAAILLQARWRAKVEARKKQQKAEINEVMESARPGFKWVENQLAEEGFSYSDDFLERVRVSRRGLSDARRASFMRSLPPGLPPGSVSPSGQRESYTISVQSLPEADRNSAIIWGAESRAEPKPQPEAERNSAIIWGAESRAEPEPQPEADDVEEQRSATLQRFGRRQQQQSRPALAGRRLSESGRRSELRSVAIQADLPPRGTIRRTPSVPDITVVQKSYYA